MAKTELMAEEVKSNSYEEARKQQLLENKKRFEDLGILKISKTLAVLSKPEKKIKQREIKPKIGNGPAVEPRRSTRERNPIRSYTDDVDIGLPTVRRRSSKSDSSWATYLARPLEEVRMAQYEERVQAMKSAEKLQSNLQSEYPSFIKSMLRSHVYSCFWLGLPQRFCRSHLPKSTVNIMLEDEDGNEYDSVFISSRTGLSGGWRAFALEHKLDDGDALIFQLVEKTRFKIYIVKASDGGSQDDEDNNMSNDEEEANETKKTSPALKKCKKTPDSSAEKQKKKPAAKNSSQTKKPRQSKEPETATRRSTRNRN